MKKIIGIYSITNKITNKRYIGKSVNIIQRFRSHKYLLNKKHRSEDTNRHLYNSVKKYGIENFDFEILETFDEANDEILKNREFYWMDFYKSCDRKFGYNLRRDSSTSCIVHDETRDLLRNRVGDKNSNFGNKWSEELKEYNRKIALKNHREGNMYGDEWRKKISEKCSLLWKDEDKKKKMAEKVSETKTIYEILQYTKNGEFVRKYDSVKDVIENNKSFKWQNIYSVCNGYKKSYKGYVWKKELKI